MKKLFFFLMAFSFVFTGCSKDDDGDDQGYSSSILGTWKLNDAELREFETSDPQMTEMFESMIQLTLAQGGLFEEFETDKLTFTDDNKLTFTDENGNVTETNTYVLNDNKITITDENGESYKATLSFSDSIMNMDMDMTEEMADEMGEEAGGLDFTVTKMIVRLKFAKQ